MGRFRMFRMVGLALMLMLAVMLSACGDSNNNETAANNGGNEMNSDDGAQLGDEEILLPYVSWASAVASTHVMKATLEDVGYDVTARQVGKGSMFSSIADGSADADTCTWLPSNSKNLWGEYKNDIDKLNKTIEKAPVGLAVPEYMDVDSIKDLKGNEEVGEATNWTLTGIEAGSGQMELTKEVMDEYGLDNWSLQPSSGSAMVGRLGDAINNDEPIIVTLWKPHFAFGKFDIKMLDDPKTTYGKFDSIYTAARQGLEDDSPAAYKVLKQFQWNEDLMNEVMVNIEEGMDPAEAGKQFIKDHPDLLDEWTKGVK